MVSAPAIASRALLSLAFLAAGVLCQETAEKTLKKLTFEQSLGQPSFGVLPRTGVATWADDGVHLRVGNQVVDALTGEKAELDPAAATQSDGQRGGRRAGRRGRPGAGGGEAPLPKHAAGAREVAASPDGKSTAFVLGRDLKVYDVAGDVVWDVTSDGGENVFNGILDWVYQEEVYGRGTFKAHWWSPDSGYLAFLRLDEKDVKTFAVVDDLPSASLDVDKTVKLELEKYPKAGDPNPTAKLLVASPADRKVLPVDLSGYDADVLIVRVGWYPEAAKVGTKAVVQLQNRIQTWLDLCSVDPLTGKVTRLFREESPCWVNVLEEPRWLADGTFLWLSERTGYKQLYHYAPDGKLLHTVTQGEWEIRDVVRVDEKQGLVWFTAGKDGACASNLYRVKLEGGEIARVTQGRGTHEAELNRDGSLLLDTVSAVDMLPVQRLCKADGSVVRVLAEAKPGDIERYEFSMPKLLAIPTRDGLVLDGVLIAPTRLEPGSKHALWIETYSGPDTPTVRDRWQPDARFQFYAQNGIAVLQVNVRSASNKGRVHTGTIYKNFTAQELKDWEDSIDWVCKQHPWIDAARVGMTGMSYGGTMTAYAMTHGDKIALGIACSGVYDWRLYDTIYTERYMDTPQANPDGYKASSCIAAARKLHGHLVLLHGTIDDNVHMQNTMRFVYALQNAGKDFELMLYPKTRHELASTQGQYLHRARLFWREMQEHLGGPRKAG